MKNIVLLGDSIFDNASYVDPGESVSEILGEMMAGLARVTLLAVDGHTTQEIGSQLENFPEDATHIFLSCGGNDGLQNAGILQLAALSVAGVLETLHGLREEFRGNYRRMLDEVLALGLPTTVCTIYKGSSGLSEAQLTGLALYNEIILEEAIAQCLPIIDLRLLCDEPEDYSEISPIEPSEQGGRKIANLISRIIEEHDFSQAGCSIYY